MSAVSVVVVGLGADGWHGLDQIRRTAVCAADVILGGERHLASLPGTVRAERVPWPRPMRHGLPALLQEYDGRSLVALASGDPLVAGVATTLIDLLGTESVEVLPGISSVSLARARMRWPAESVEVLRGHRTLPRHLAPGRRLLVLSADSDTPAAVAEALTDRGFGASLLTVLAGLGSPAESRQALRAVDWPAGTAAPALHTLAVECVADATALPLGLASGLPDEAFSHDGQLTRRDLRASAIARLAPSPGDLLWDVGAGAGSVGIEWMRVHPHCRTVAVEADATRAERVTHNAQALGVPGLEVVCGSAPAALAGLPAPQAVFVGGGGSAPGVIEECWAALRPGGRIVLHAVTLETEHALARHQAELGGEQTRVHVEHAAPIGRLTGWTPSRAVVQWCAVKPTEGTTSP